MVNIRSNINPLEISRRIERPLIYKYMTKYTITVWTRDLQQ